MKDSNGTEIKAGDKVYINGFAALLTFTGGKTKKGQYICEGSNKVLVYGYCVKVPSTPKYIPWTLETIPMPFPIIREKGNSICKAITIAANNGCTIMLLGSYTPKTYQHIFEHFEVVNPDRTTSPCGVLK